MPKQTLTSYHVSLKICDGLETCPTTSNSGVRLCVSTCTDPVAVQYARVQMAADFAYLATDSGRLACAQTCGAGHVILFHILICVRHSFVSPCTDPVAVQYARVQMASDFASNSQSYLAFTFGVWAASTLITNPLFNTIKTGEDAPATHHVHKSSYGVRARCQIWQPTAGTASVMPKAYRPCTCV